MNIMKTVSTLFFILIGAIALANNKIDVKVEVIEMGVVLDRGIDASKDTSPIETSTSDSIARIYRIPNSRVKKALTFRPEFHRTKLA